MLMSRGASLLRSFNNVRNATSGHQQQIIRNSHNWYYRTGAPEQKNLELVAEIIGGVAWWWILWHLWTEPGHIFGEFEYPDASKWTDEELGIID